MALSALIFPLLLAAAPLSVDADRLRCPKPVTTQDRATFKRLGDLPPAEAFFAVLRSSECRAPMIQARDKLGRVPKPRP